MDDTKEPAGYEDNNGAPEKETVSSLLKKNPKTIEQIIKEVKDNFFKDEIDNDIAQTKRYLNRGAAAEKYFKEHRYPNSPILEQEQKALDVYKRALILAGTGGLNIIDDNGNEKGAELNKLPVSSYFSHGGRIMVEIPKDTGDNLINWLSTGQTGTPGLSREQTQEGAIKKGMVVYNREAATHDVVITKKGNNEHVLTEKQGFWIGARDYIKNNFFGQKTNHFGVDLAFDADFDGKDSTGSLVARPDGEHGHLYMHYQAPTKDRPGSLLIGVEGAAPTSDKHSKTGARNPLSAMMSSKFSDLKGKLEDLKKSNQYLLSHYDLTAEELLKNENLSAEEKKLLKYNDVVLPKPFGGLSIKLGIENLTAITKLDADAFNVELASVVPGEDVSKFQENIEKAKEEIIAEKKTNEEKAVKKDNTLTPKEEEKEMKNDKSLSSNPSKSIATNTPPRPSTPPPPLKAQNPLRVNQSRPLSPSPTPPLPRPKNQPFVKQGFGKRS